MTDHINSRRRYMRMLFGAVVLSPLTPSVLHAIEKKGDNLFAMTEEGRLYWIDGGMGYCGAALQPDTEEIKAAAEAGNDAAEFRLSQLYDSGRWGVDKDPQEAFKWYLLAAQGGMYEAMQKVAFKYEFGKGVDEDIREALKWYQKAHELRLENTNLLEKIQKLESQLGE